MSTACLRTGAADLLLDFLEACFNFPSSTIIFNDLLHAQAKVRGYQRYRLALVKNPDTLTRQRKDLSITT